jgi:hypothetical protein
MGLDPDYSGDGSDSEGRGEEREGLPEAQLPTGQAGNLQGASAAYVTGPGTGIKVDGGGGRVGGGGGGGWMKDGNGNWVRAAQPAATSRVVRALDPVPDGQCELDEAIARRAQVASPLKKNGPPGVPRVDVLCRRLR